MDAAIYKLMHAHGVNYTVAPVECICMYRSAVSI